MGNFCLRPPPNKVMIRDQRERQERREREYEESQNMQRKARLMKCLENIREMDGSNQDLTLVDKEDFFPDCNSLTEEEFKEIAVEIEKKRESICQISVYVDVLPQSKFYNGISQILSGLLIPNNNNNEEDNKNSLFHLKAFELLAGCGENEDIENHLNMDNMLEWKQFYKHLLKVEHVIIGGAKIDDKYFEMILNIWEEGLKEYEGNLIKMKSLTIMINPLTDVGFTLFHEFLLKHNDSFNKLVDLNIARTFVSLSVVKKFQKSFPTIRLDYDLTPAKEEEEKKNQN